jgi:hypothetical protein
MPGVNEAAMIYSVAHLSLSREELPGDQYSRGDEEQARECAYPRLQCCKEDSFLRSLPLITENPPEPLDNRKLQH